jgi:hypothetical protein
MSMLVPVRNRASLAPWPKAFVLPSRIEQGISLVFFRFPNSRCRFYMAFFLVALAALVHTRETRANGFCGVTYAEYQTVFVPPDR